jgi:hypothetical protein
MTEPRNSNSAGRLFLKELIRDLIDAGMIGGLW